MRKLLTTFVCVWFTLAVWAGDGIYEKLQQITQISEIQKLDVKPFQEYYQFWFEQPVDHSDPAKGTFRQRVLLGHKQSDAPVIVELEGYNIWSSEEGELANILKGNQLTIEHRFFDQSVPEGGIPWENLTIKQAADDQHEIIQAIRQKIYPASKWISTGISKGGQTTIFHRYFYPADVDISVPYVAPLNLEYVDPRLDKFLNRLGTAKSGVKALFNWEDLNTCHYTIRDFQTMCFEHLDTLLPMLEELAAEKKYTYRMVGGTKRALQLMILEYPFAFWQWGNNCADIPDQESADWEEIFEYLDKLPLNVELTVNGRQYLLTHAAPVDLYESYDWKYKSARDFAVWMRFEKFPVLEGRTVIFGHTPTHHFQPDDPMAVWDAPGWIGIDCGCMLPETGDPRSGLRGRLACLRLDDMRVFYSEEPQYGDPEEAENQRSGCARKHT